MGAEPRPYEPHWGPKGEDVAKALARVGEPPEVQPDDAHHALATWLGGASVLDMASEAGRPVNELELTLRRALAEVQTEDRDRALIWDQAVQLLGMESRKLAEAGYEEMEGWDPDPFLYGMKIGRGEAQIAAKTLLATIANAMKRRELG